MKNIIIFSLLIFLTTSVLGQGDKSYKDLIGKWKGEDSKTLGIVEFLDSSNLIISVNGQTSLSYKYSMNFLKNPIWMDLTSSGGTQYCLLQFLGHGKLKWQVFTSASRPDDFTKDKKQPVMILKRAK